MRLNQHPIFINAFSRGGSNILWNMLLTHPDVCSPIVETLDIFRIGQHGRWSGYKAAWLTRQPLFFAQKNLSERRPISHKAQAYIDETLYAWKLKTYSDEEMCFKRENETYTIDEVKQARLVAKNNNGLAFLSDPFLDIYPGATFFGLVRHPLALYESYKRRKFITSMDDFITFYRTISERMISDSERIGRYYLVRFEDILSNFKPTLERLYAQAELDMNAVEKVRFKAKRHYQNDGSRSSDYTIGTHYWMSFAEAEDFLEEGINTYQIQRLDPIERLQIEDDLSPLMEKLGYTWGDEA